MEQLKSKICDSVKQSGYYCYDVLFEKENNRFFVRVLIDSKTGITIDDCSNVSDGVSTLLDELDPFKDPYFLEVMSAGIEHELRNDEEIKLSIGKKVQIKTFDQTMVGTLLKFKDGLITLQIERKKIQEVNVMDITDCRLSL